MNEKTQLVEWETRDSNLKYQITKIIKKALSIAPIYRIVNIITIYRINKNTKTSAMNVLCVDDNDERMRFLEIESKNFDLNIIWFPRRVVDWLFQKHIKIYKTIGLGEWSLDQYYDNNVVNQSAREKLRKQYSILLNDIQKLLKIKCLVLPKLNDDWIVDFQLAADKIGIPIVVSDRESAITKKRMEIYPPLLKKHVEDLSVAKYICVNNDMHREFFIRSGIDENKLKLTGSPQSDIWSVKRNSEALNAVIKNLDKKKKNILYMSFGVRAYLNFFYSDESRNWDSLYKEVHEELADFIIKNKDDVNVLYKIGSKPARDYWSGFDDFYKKLKDNGAESSLIQLKGKILTPELLPYIDLTISFQTTGVVEAMFHDSPIIYLGWGELYEDIKHTLHNFENSGVLYASSKEKLRNLMNMFIDDELPEMETYKFNKWKYDFFYKADGNSSSRILKVVSDTISQI